MRMRSIFLSQRSQIQPDPNDASIPAESQNYGDITYQRGDLSMLIRGRNYYMISEYFKQQGSISVEEFQRIN